MLCFEVGCHPVEVADFHDGIFIAVVVLDRLCRFGFRLGFRNIFVFDATDGHACVFVMRVYTRIHRQIEIGCRKGLRIVAGRAPEVGVARHPAVADGHAGRQCGEAGRIGRIVTAAPILVGRHQRIGAFLVVERQQPQLLFGGNFPAFRAEVALLDRIIVVEQAVFFTIVRVILRDAGGGRGQCVPCVRAAVDDRYLRAVVVVRGAEVGGEPLHAVDFDDGIGVAIVVADRGQLGFGGIARNDAALLPIVDLGADGERRALRRHADCSGEEMALARLEGEFRTGFVGHCLAFERKIDDRLARFACLRDYDGRKAGDVVALDSRRAVGTDVGHVGRLAECLGIDIVECRTAKIFEEHLGFEQLVGSDAVACRHTDLHEAQDMTECDGNSLPVRLHVARDSDHPVRSRAARGVALVGRDSDGERRGIGPESGLIIGIVGIESIGRRGIGEVGSCR